jgi:hypothetical protein
MPDTKKKRLPNTNPQPEYVPPSRLVKCHFAKDQKLFWLETSEWFRAHHRYNESVKFDTDFNEPQPLYEAFKKIVPEKFQRAVWGVGQSVFQAFQIVQNKELGVDTKSFPKGSSDEGTYNHWEERKKKIALMALKRGSKLWNPQVYPVMEQAIRENDIEFFRRELPETLNRRKVVCFNPDEPERGILAHWLVSFWCPGDYWPAWADSNLPPLCIFMDEAITEFFSSGKDNPGTTTVEAVRQCRKRLGLKRFTQTNRIRKVILKNGCFHFQS